MELKVIAYARNGHTDKFGIPRQSREESPIVTRIVFEPEFAVPEAVRGIEGYSHLWLIWGFDKVESQKSKAESDSWSPTVRPPRLGGNKRVGVFATRSPFRPNPIGLSSVKNLTPTLSSREGERHPQAGVYIGESGRMELIVSGADVMDGTPIYDIKPYLSFSDSHPEAVNGFAEETKDYRLKVDWSKSGRRSGTDDGPMSDRQWTDDVSYILSQDPRPAYQDDPEREYKMDYAGYTITFSVKEQTVLVKKIEKSDK
jgi:tRNA-Thr(GGU) m(6)t(6)A37 methyltransferase TsaA